MARQRNVLERAAKWLHRQERDHMAKLVVYQRGTERCTVEAKIGETVFETLEEAANIIVKTESRDFLIRREELKLSEGVLEPRRGDRIHERHGATTVVYEVNAPGDERCFAWDTHHDRFRIHTKEMDSY